MLHHSLKPLYLRVSFINSHNEILHRSLGLFKPHFHKQTFKFIFYVISFFKKMLFQSRGCPEFALLYSNIKSNAWKYLSLVFKRIHSLASLSLSTKMEGQKWSKRWIVFLFDYLRSFLFPLFTLYCTLEKSKISMLQTNFLLKTASTHLR